jgi:preprotein translocase subunit SecD
VEGARDAADGVARVPVRGPNFFSDATLKALPAGRSGMSCSGSTAGRLAHPARGRRQLRAQGKGRAAADDVRRVLREARVGYTGLVVRGLTVEVRIREESNFDTALAKLRELSQPLGGLLSATGQRSLDVVEAGNRVIQLTITQPAITERIRQSIEQSIQIVERRVNELGTVEPLIQRQGVDRILVQVPGLSDPERLIKLIGQTAKLTFRMVDMSISPDQAQQGRVPPESDLLYGPQKDGKQPY